MDRPNSPKIVSGKHLATADSWPLSELEFALTLLNNAFNKWMVRCSYAVCKYDLTPLEILALHNIHHRDNEQRLVDICFMLNIEDSHTVNYALKKLVKHGLITSQKRGKEVFYATTDQGHSICEQYKEVREQCLVPGVLSIDNDPEHLSKVATTMRTLSGLYDQAARSAASIS